MTELFRVEHGNPAPHECLALELAIHTMAAREITVVPRSAAWTARRYVPRHSWAFPAAL
ncbi:hypothetical protein ACFROC_09925 [Nocardia tengchongensis]|uniref:hypothetical protein n=1 Tax=Nocardia tengchongensis TaxID=2055889 RepID=UPI00368723C8